MLPDGVRQLPQRLLREVAAGLPGVGADAVNGQHVDAAGLVQIVFRCQHKNPLRRLFSILRLVRRKWEKILSEGNFFFYSCRRAVSPYRNSFRQ